MNKRQLKKVHSQVNGMDLHDKVRILMDVFFADFRRQYPQWLGVQHDEYWDRFVEIFDDSIIDVGKFFLLMNDASRPEWFRIRWTLAMFFPWSNDRYVSKKEIIPEWVVRNRNVFSLVIKDGNWMYFKDIDSWLMKFVIDMHAQFFVFIQGLEEYGDYLEILQKCQERANCLLEKLEEDVLSEETVRHFIESYPLCLNAAYPHESANIFSFSVIKNLSKSKKGLAVLCRRMQDSIRSKSKIDTQHRLLKWYAELFFGPGDGCSAVHNGFLTKKTYAQQIVFICEFPEVFREMINEESIMDTDIKEVMDTLDSEKFSSILEGLVSLFIQNQGDASENVIACFEKRFGYIDGFSEWKDVQLKRCAEEVKQRDVAEQKRLAQLQAQEEAAKIRSVKLGEFFNDLNGIA